MIKYELFIKHGESFVLPPVADGVTIEWERTGQPGKLTFEVVKTAALSFEEGDECRFSVNGTPVFFGFVFDKSRTGSAPEKIKVVVYDQLYYFKNKTCFDYDGSRTLTEVIKMLAEDFGLKTGVLEDSTYKIAERTEENKSLFDIVSYPFEETLKATGQMYVLYDDAGKLTLTGIANMKLDHVINERTVGDFDYSTSISNNTYNTILLLRDGQAPVFLSDYESVKKWGVLQYCEKVSDENANLQSMASALLKTYNTKGRNLSAKKALGDIRVRGGTLLPFILSLGDINV